MATAPSKARQAKILIGDKTRTVHVLHPGKLTPDDINRINEKLINDVIKNLTGCACLSGIIDVLWERDYERVLDVGLGEAFH